jgi:hypothetical protein
VAKPVVTLAAFAANHEARRFQRRVVVFRKDFGQALPGFRRESDAELA